MARAVMCPFQTLSEEKAILHPQSPRRGELLSLVLPLGIEAASPRNKHRMRAEPGLSTTTHISLARSLARCPLQPHLQQGE